MTAAIPAPTLTRLLGAWNPDPRLLTLLVGAGAFYLIAARRAGHNWPVVRSASFLAGLAAIAVALCSGIDRYSDYLLSVHMVEHMLLMMVAPVLLACGAPVRLALAACGHRGRRAIASLLHRRVVRLASRPAFGTSLLCATLLLTYFTSFFELSLHDETVHALEHAVFLCAGVLCFAPLVAADPLPRPPGALARLGWLTIVMTAMVVVGAMLSFDGTVRYPHYLGAARALHISALADQQLAGVLMWFGGGIFGAALTLVLVTKALFAEERRQRRRDRYATDPRTPRPERAPMVTP